MKQPDNNLIIKFLISPAWRLARHIPLQALFIISTLDVFLNANLPESGEYSVTARLYGSIGYYLCLNFIIYFNLYVLVPRYLLKEKLLKYIFSFLIFIPLSMIIVIAVQMGFFPDAHVETAPESFPVWFTSIYPILNLISSNFTIGLLVTGTSAMVMVKCWITNSLRMDEIQSSTLQSELKYLRNQINPHFLFNMINNANVLIKRNPAEASKTLFKLEDLLRYQISESSKDRVALASEIRSLNDFLNLEKIRRDKLEYTLSEEGDIDEISLPPLLFIPFVENAVKYSFDSEHPSYISVSFKVWNNKLNFLCENTLPETEIKKNKVGGLGLMNIQRRLELLYPNKHTLIIEKTKNKYTVKLQIKL